MGGLTGQGFGPLRCLDDHKLVLPSLVGEGQYYCFGSIYFLYLILQEDLCRPVYVKPVQPEDELFACQKQLSCFSSAGTSFLNPAGISSGKNQTPLFQPV